MRQRFLATTALVGMISLLVCLPRTSRADDSSQTGPHNSEFGPYQVDWAFDVGLTTGAFVIFVMPRLLFGTSVDPYCSLDCDANDLNGLDQLVIGKHSQTAPLVSDIGAVTSIVGPFLVTALDGLLLASGSDQAGLC